VRNSEVGLDYVDAVTTLLQRVRNAHPTHGSYQAAELQWWWSVPRSTDDFDQLFWFDDLGRPEAAFIVTDFGDGSSALYEDPTLVVALMPDADPGWVAHVVERGLAHLGEHGIGAVELEVDRADDAMIDVLSGHGFTRKGEGMIECWMEVGLPTRDQPLCPTATGSSIGATRTGVPITWPIRVDRTSSSGSSRRRCTARISIWSSSTPTTRSPPTGCSGTTRSRPPVWSSPCGPSTTTSAVVSPGTSSPPASTCSPEAGAERISIAFHPDNPASGQLYRSVGFEPHRQTDVWSRGTEPVLP
jgi:hypothetical protein